MKYESDLDQIDNYETKKFISYMKQNIPYSIDSSNTLKLNRLCSLEDWNNDEIRQTFLNCTSQILLLYT